MLSIICHIDGAIFSQVLCGFFLLAFLLLGQLCDVFSLILFESIKECCVEGVIVLKVNVLRSKNLILLQSSALKVECFAVIRLSSLSRKWQLVLQTASEIKKKKGIVVSYFF